MHSLFTTIRQQLLTYDKMLNRLKVALEFINNFIHDTIFYCFHLHPSNNHGQNLPLFFHRSVHNSLPVFLLPIALLLKSVRNDFKICAGSLPAAAWLVDHHFSMRKNKAFSFFSAAQ